MRCLKLELASFVMLEVATSCLDFMATLVLDCFWELQVTGLKVLMYYNGELQHILLTRQKLKNFMIV